MFRENSAIHSKNLEKKVCEAAPGETLVLDLEGVGLGFSMGEGGAAGG
jgi:hypothetical protein